ncbi:MAG: hypothetical protein K2H84_05110 [Paramuribaculum sp.]|nr:hypothetical protein [Paramuribaculum sp.]
MGQKKALILTNGFMNLHQPLVNELERVGWNVTLIKDCVLEGDPKLRSTPVRNFAKRFIRLPKHVTWHRRAEQYWSDIFPTLDNHYNLFICLNSFTISPTILNKMKERTERSVLYVWDSSAIWDFSEISRHFDAAYTFDLNDATKHLSLSLLPNYYVAPAQAIASQKKYSAVILGYDRDRRINFLSALATELSRHGLTDYNFKLIPHPLPPLSQRLFKNYSLSKKLSSGNLDDFLLKEPVTPREYMEMMEQSEIIVDDVMPKQSGLTPRFIWGLARGKKIITTNRYALRYNFVAPENICIVDRKNPIIPEEFIKATPVENPPILSTLEIRNWVRIISGDEPLPDYRNRLQN